MRKKKQAHLGEKGIALIFVLFLAIIIVGALYIGMQLITVALRESHKQKAIYAQGEAIAKAGIADTLSWFRRHQRQPVCSEDIAQGAVYPDAAFDPTGESVTIDESIGIVQEEYLTTDSPSLVARYEIKRQTVNNGTDSSLTDPEAVHDITNQKIQGGRAGQGYVWYIESHGYIYVKRDSAVDYDVPQTK